MYGISSIVSEEANPRPIVDIYEAINSLNYLIAVLGVISTVGAMILMELLRGKIEAQDEQTVQKAEV